MENEDKVIVDFEKYHSNMNELDDLRNIILEYVFHFDKMTHEELLEKIEILNKKYQWWV